MIDSLTVTPLQPPDLRRLIEATGAHCLLALLQVTKKGEAAGAMGYLHEADVVIGVEELRWTVEKSRYQALPVSGAVLPKLPAR